MLLKREGVQYCRVMREGNELLRVKCAGVGGESAAAAHTAALMEALLQYAKTELAERLATEGAEGVPFCRYRYEIDWREEAEPGGCAIILTTLLARGREVLEAKTLATYWDDAGAYQRKAAPSKSGKIRKNLLKKY